MESSKKEAIVHRSPHVMNGALFFAGACVPVKILMDHLAAGDSLGEFLEGFPDMSHEQAVAYQKMAREAAEGASAEDGLLAGRRRR